MKQHIHEAHGKLETSQPTTLEQVWGFNEMAKYGTMDETAYAAQLDDMNNTDLHAHARKVGVVIVDSITRLRANLLKEFRNYTTYLKKPVALGSTSQPKTPTKEVQSILNEGR